MKLILSGLSPETDLDKLSERMRYFGPVRDINVIREGDPDCPWFLIELDITPDVATEVARRIDGLYFNGRFIHARVMLHP